MKIHLKFDHKRKDLLDAIDCQVDGEQVDYLIRDIMQKYSDDDSITKLSQMAELIHDKLDYEISTYIVSV